MTPEENDRLAGLSPEVRAELEALAGAEGSSGDAEGEGLAEGEGSVGKTADSEQVPAWATALTAKQAALGDLVRTLDASNRTLQGQVRSFEARGSRPPPQAEDDPYEGLDLDDPTTRTLVGRLKKQDAEIEALKGSVRGSQVSAAEQAERANWMTYLDANATKLGVSFAEHEAALRRLSTADLPVEGMALLIGAKPSGSNGHTPETADTERARGRREGIEALAKQLGIWDEVRAGLGAKPDGTLTADEIDNMSAREFADRNISDEDLAKALAKKK